MSKQSGRDLFNISLTEIIIILFFVLMLFAIFQINNLNEEKKEIEKQNENLIAQVNAKGDNISPNPIVVTIDPEAPVEDMTNEEKLAFIGAAIDRLNIYEEQNPEIAGTDVDPCEANPFECLPDCWELKNKAPSGRDYEYLFDIAICETSYFVQRAPIDKLGQYTSSDFRRVPNAILAENRFFKNADLEGLFGKIRKHGESQDRQCRYSINLVDIKSSKRELTFAYTKSAIVNNFKVKKVDVDKVDYSDYLERFPKNVCSTNKTRTSTNKITKKEGEKITMSEAWRRAESNRGKLNWNGDIENCPDLRNKAFSLRLEVLIGKTGGILAFKDKASKYDGSRINLGRNERKMIDLIKKLIKKAGGKGFKNSKGEPDFSQKIYKSINFKKNLCR
tara:strand:+ start:343 stop:1515 length:1173 start_codon:yes stop_codon:yes gene_type:complete